MVQVMVLIELIIHIPVSPIWLDSPDSPVAPCKLLKWIVQGLTTFQCRQQFVLAHHISLSCRNPKSAEGTGSLINDDK